MPMLRASYPALSLTMVMVAVAAIALSGCALEAPPSREALAAIAAPHRQLPVQWGEPQTSATDVGDQWLASFRDPQLSLLAKEALAYNPDLASAAARVEQAMAYQRVAGALLSPQVNLLARDGGKLSGDASGLEGVGLFVHWEIDVWGRVRAGAAAAQAQTASAALDAEYARQSLVAQIAKGWFLATEATLQKRLAEDAVRASAQLASLAQDRLRVGVGDEYDVRLAQAHLSQLRDTVRNLEASTQQAVRALETLAGRYPNATLAVPLELAATSMPIPAGMPAALLERRPDVVAAERRVAAAFYNTQQAKAARLPQISLTGAVTGVSSDLFVLQNRENPVWSVGGSLLAPIFLGGQLEGQVERRSAEQKQALADFGRTGARAFSEVENGLSTVFALDARELLLRQAVADQAHALALVRTRVRVGSSDLRAALQQNLALYAAQVALLRVRSERLVQRVNLYLALGGSFDERPAEVASGGPNAAFR